MKNRILSSVIVVLLILPIFSVSSNKVYGESISAEFLGKWQCYVQDINFNIDDMRSEIEASIGQKLPEDAWNAQKSAIQSSLNGVIPEAMKESNIMNIYSEGNKMVVETIGNDGTITKASSVTGSGSRIIITSPTIQEYGTTMDATTTMTLTSNSTASLVTEVYVAQNGMAFNIKLSGKGEKVESYKEVIVEEPEESVEATELLITGDKGQDLDSSYMYLGVDEVKKLTYKIYPENANIDALEWFSNDESVVTVTQNGEIKGHNIGETMIGLWCPGKDYLQDVITIYVEPKSEIEDIIIMYTKDSINIGENIKLHYRLLPENADENSLGELIWYSYNNTIASVNSNGVVTGLKEGMATIEVKSKENENITDLVVIKVSPSFANQEAQNAYNELNEKLEEAKKELENLLDKIIDNNPDLSILDLDTSNGNFKKIFNNDIKIDGSKVIDSDFVKEMYDINKKEIEKNVDKIFEELGKKVPNADLLSSLVKKGIDDELTNLYDKGKKSNDKIKKQLFEVFTNTSQVQSNPLIIVGDAFCKKLLDNTDKTKTLSKIASLPINIAINHQKDAYKQEYDMVVNLVKRYKELGNSVEEAERLAYNDLTNSHDELSSVINDFEEGYKNKDLKKIVLAGSYISNRTQVDRYSKKEYTSFNNRFNKYMELSKLNMEYE